MLAGEHATRSSKAREHLIGDHQHAVAVTELADAVEKLAGPYDHAACTLQHRFDEHCRDLLGDSPRFVLLNTYTTVLTRGQPEKQAYKLHSLLAKLLAGYPATITCGELALADSGGRQISASVFARAALAAPALQE